MRTLLIGLTAMSLTTFAVPAFAQTAELDYPKGSLGYEALLRADFNTAESQLRGDQRIPRSDPARLINLGQVLALTGRGDEARQMFARALERDDVELVMSDGRTMSSHDAALTAMRALKPELASR